MKKTIIIYILALVGAMLPTGRADDGPSPRFPDSLVALAHESLVDRLGAAFFENHVALTSTMVSPTGAEHPSLFVTRWRIDFPGHGEISYEVGFDGRGSILGDIHLPPCAQEPSICQITIDKTIAVAIAESTLEAMFDPELIPAAILKYERPPWDCFVWHVGGPLISDDAWERSGNVLIAVRDGAIVRVHRTEMRKFAPTR